MPTDTVIAVNAGFGRQEGLVRRVADTPATARAGERKGQDLSVSGQTLPPGKVQGDDKQLEQAISNINSYVQNLQRDLQFKVDTDLGKIVISVVDSETKEVIRQIPPEDVLERARRLEAQTDTGGTANGLLFQVKI